MLGLTHTVLPDLYLRVTADSLVPSTPHGMVFDFLVDFCYDSLHGFTSLISSSNRRSIQNCSPSRATLTMFRPD